MFRHTRSAVSIVALLVLLLPALSANAQEKTDAPTKYAELCGTYLGHMKNGQPLDIVVAEVGGVLQGAPSNETPMAFVPVAGKELTFTLQTGDGGVFTVVFGRNDKKEIVKLTLSADDGALELTKSK
jgi:hypothetical protein